MNSSFYLNKSFSTTTIKRSKSQIRRKIENLRKDFDSIGDSYHNQSNDNSYLKKQKNSTINLQLGKKLNLSSPKIIFDTVMNKRNYSNCIIAIV